MKTQLPEINKFIRTEFFSSLQLDIKKEVKILISTMLIITAFFFSLMISFLCLDLILVN